MNSPRISCRRLFAIGLLAACIGSAQAQGIQQATGPGVVPPNVDLKNVKILQRLGNQVPLDVPFKDQFGKDVTVGSILGKRPAMVVSIFYRCTGVCSIELENIVGVLEKMGHKRVGKDFDVIVVGINPKETPDLAKAKFAQIMASSPKFKGTEDGWHLLTGKLDNIRSVTSPLGFYYTYDPVRDVVNHPAGLTFITPKGIVSSYILGAKFPTETVEGDIDLAAKNQIGLKSADVFFGCIHIDPITGQRSIVIENVLKVAGVVTVIAIALMLLTLSGKNRWAKRKLSPDDWQNV